VVELRFFLPGSRCPVAVGAAAGRSTGEERPVGRGEGARRGRVLARADAAGWEAPVAERPARARLAARPAAPGARARPAAPEASLEPPEVAARVRAASLAFRARPAAAEVRVGLVEVEARPGWPPGGRRAAREVRERRGVASSQALVAR
jgi:hypothetical protein